MNASDSYQPLPSPEGFQQLGFVVLGEDGLSDLLDRVVQLAAMTMPSAHSVSITAANGKQVYTSNSSGPDALELDEAQYAGKAGPCLDAIGAGQLERNLEQARERWPQLASRAQALGVQTVLSTPLTVNDRAVGALNVYSRSDSKFTEAEKHTATLFAGQAAVLLANAFTLQSSLEMTEQLREALASREVIGEAKGILMQQQGCTRDEAFDLLRRASQRENRKLRDVAQAVVEAVEARAERRTGP